MCKCDPNGPRTPYCGKGDCQWPPQSVLEESPDKEIIIKISEDDYNYARSDGCFASNQTPEEWISDIVHDEIEHRRQADYAYD